MSEIRDKYILDASQYLNSMQRVVQATKAQADMAREASFQATMNARRAADATREAARVQKNAIREAEEAEKTARKENTDAARQAAEAARQRAEQAKKEYEQQAHSAQKAREAELRAKEAAHEATRAEREATEAAKEHARSQQELGKATDDLNGKIKGMVTAYVSLQSVAKLVQLSDEYSGINAKLEMMEDRLGDTKAMQDAIMDSARRSRASYMDTANLVTKLGTMASGAFGSFDELVAFSEQINKNLVLSGASATEAGAATLQLAQALSAGVLRGDELNSVMEQAPMITERIAQYLEIDKGKIRELASEGMITAEIVKNAMLSTAEETNSAFEGMPMTWSQVWTEATNLFVEYSQPILEIISLLAQNFDTLVPIIAGVSAGLAAYAIAQTVSTAITWLAVDANRAFLLSLATNPILWIAVAIGVVVALIVKWIQKVGGLKIAWLTCVDGVLTAFDNLATAVETIWKGIVLVVAGAVSAIALGVQNAINGVIGKINTFIATVNAAIGLLNSVPGVSIPIIPEIKNVSFGDSAKAAFGDFATEQYTSLRSNIASRAQKHADRQNEISRLISEKESEKGRENPYSYITEGIPGGNIPNGDGGGSSGGGGTSGGKSGSGSGKLGKISSDVSDIKKSVEMTHEDLSLLVDMATRKYVANVNLETRAPVINITGQNTGDSEADAMRIADELKRILLEQMSSGGSLSYALP